MFQELTIVSILIIKKKIKDHKVPFHINFNSILRRDHKKISYERRAYESVDEKSLSYVMSRKTTKKFVL